MQEKFGLTFRLFLSLSLYHSEEHPLWRGSQSQGCATVPLAIVRSSSFPPINETKKLGLANFREHDLQSWLPGTDLISGLQSEIGKELETKRFRPHPKNRKNSRKIGKWPPNLNLEQMSGISHFSAIFPISWPLFTHPFFLFAPLCWPPLFLSFSGYLFSLFSPLEKCSVL